MRLSQFLILFGACLTAIPANAATVRGTVAGDVEHMPWRKGKRELGWCTVRALRDGVLAGTTRTNAGQGDFELTGLPSGPTELEISRPGFLTERRKLDVSADTTAPVAVHLRPDPDYTMIVLPRTGMALTRTPGETFTIECLAPSAAQAWSAALETEYFSRPLKLASATFGQQAVWNETKAGWRLTVRVPGDTPAEMYRLRVDYLDGEGRRHSGRQSKAVCIRASYADDFLLMPYTDFHFNWLVNQHGVAGEVQADYFKAASLVNPLLVSLGDDIGFEGDDHYAMFHYLVDRYLDVPIYLAFGNHDAALTTGGHEFYFGPRWQTRRIGPHVGLVSSYDLYQAEYAMPQDQRDGVAEALARFEADPENKVLILAGHQTAWPPNKHEPFFKLPFTSEDRPTFPGHNDGQVNLDYKRLFIDSLCVGSMHGWAGLNYTGRVMRIARFRRAELFAQCALPSVVYEGPNNSTVETQTAVIHLTGWPKEKWTPPKDLYTGGYFCDLPKAWDGLPSLRDARLRFVMRKGRYRCHGGRILTSVDGDAGKATVVYVAADVNQSVLRVTVSPE